MKFGTIVTRPVYVKFRGKNKCYKVEEELFFFFRFESQEERSLFGCNGRFVVTFHEETHVN